MARAWEAAAAETDGVLIALSESESRLTEMLAEGPVSLEEFMLSAKVSRSTAEDIVVRLHTMDLLDFFYNGKTFLLSRRPDEKEEM